MTIAPPHRAWRELSRPVQVVVVAMFVICAVPPATNVGPGMAGYALVLVVLAVVTLWLIDGRPIESPLPRAGRLAVVALFGWVSLGVLRAWSHVDTAVSLAVAASRYDVLRSSLTPQAKRPDGANGLQV